MDVDDTPVARCKSDKLGLRLGFGKFSQRIVRVGHIDVVVLISGKQQKNAGIRATLMELPGRMQVPGPDLQAGDNTQATCDPVTHAFERLAPAVPSEGQEGIQREIVALADRPEKQTI